MLCPRCHDAFLDEIEREGVIVDVCRKCRGLWLDRGELEKLRAGAAREVFDGHPRRYDDDRHHPRRKKGLVDLLGELID